MAPDRFSRRDLLDSAVDIFKNVAGAVFDVSGKAAGDALNSVKNMNRREFGALLAGVVGTAVAGKFCGEDLEQEVKQEVAATNVCPQIESQCPESQKKQECETILDKTLGKMIAEMTESLKKQFNLSPEDLANKKVEAQKIAADVNTAFQLLANYRLQHRTDTPKEDVIDDDYFAARVDDGPFAGKVIVIRNKKYKPKANPAAAVIEETVIDQPSEANQQYRAIISPTGKGNGVNRDYQITLEPRSEGVKVTATLLAVKKSVRLPDGEKEMIYAPPHNDNLHNPYLIAKGFHYFQELINHAWSRVRYMGENMSDYQNFSYLVEESMIAAIMMTENVDADMLMKGANGHEMTEEYLKVLLTLGLNEKNAFMMRNSSAGARGVLQVIPNTHKALNNKYGKKILSGDFVKDTLDHKYAAILAILHLYSQYEQILNRKTIYIDAESKILTPTHIEGENHIEAAKRCYYSEEIFPAGYNSSMKGVLDLIVNNLPYPETLRQETRPYLEKFRMAQVLLDFLKTFCKEAIPQEQVAGLQINPSPLVAVQQLKRPKGKQKTAVPKKGARVPVKKKKP